MSILGEGMKDGEEARYPTVTIGAILCRTRTTGAEDGYQPETGCIPNPSCNPLMVPEPRFIEFEDVAEPALVDADGHQRYLVFVAVPLDGSSNLLSGSDSVCSHLSEGSNCGVIFTFQRAVADRRICGVITFTVGAFKVGRQYNCGVIIRTRRRGRMDLPPLPRDCCHTFVGSH